MVNYKEHIERSREMRYYVELDHPVRNAGTGGHIVLYLYAKSIEEITNMFREYLVIVVEQTE